MSALLPRELGVVGHGTASQYHALGKSLAEMAKDLSVDYVLEGSVQRVGQRMRINSQLIQIADQTQLFAESFDRPIGDLLTVQEEIAERLAGALAVELRPAPQRAAVDSVGLDSAAVDAYLRGERLFTVSSESLERAVGNYKRAIALEPGFARAYAGLAVIYHMQASADFVPDAEAYPKSRAAAQRAIELDGNLSGPWGSLGFVELQFGWNWQASERYFSEEARRSGQAGSHLYALFLHAMARHDEALAEITRVLENDPSSMLARWNRARMALYAGQHRLALEEFERIASLVPNSPLAAGLGEALVHLGRVEEGVAQLEKISDASGEAVPVQMRLAFAYAVADSAERARELLARLERQGRYVPTVPLAVVYGALGEFDTAFGLLEQAYQERDDRLVTLNVDSWFAPLREDPRFDELLARMNFPGPAI